MINFLANLPKIVKKRKKRVGRGLGSGKGAKSGRGTTRHQKARESIPIHFEGGQGRIVKKFPLLRGKGKNKPISPKPVAVAVAKLNQFKDGQVVDFESLLAKGIIKNDARKRGVKILAKGKLERQLIIRLPCSQKVETMVKQLGGKVENNL